MAVGPLEQIVIDDFDTHLDHIQNILRNYRDDNPQVVDYILDLESVDNIEQAEIIHLARYIIREENEPTADEVVNSGRYRKASDAENKYHRDENDPLNAQNEKWLSEDGLHEYIVRPVTDPETGQTTYEFVTDIKFKGTPNYGTTTCSSDHVVLDMNPYYCWGNGSNDPNDRSASERLGVVEAAIIVVTDGPDLPWFLEPRGSAIGQGSVDILCSPKNLIEGIGDAADDIIDKIKEKFEEATQTRSPLVLDLGGNGVETLGLSARVYFDHDGNGFAENTGWVGAGDGLLVLDQDEDGRITTGAELFGDRHASDAAGGFENGFQALASYDENGDGQISSADSVFSELRVWVDRDADAETDEGELLTLQDAGVFSISVSYTETEVVDQNGNSHLQSGTYTALDGQSRAAHDVWFAIDTARTVDQRDITFTDDILALPEVFGFGNVGSLRATMAGDNSGRLKAALQAYIGASTDAQRMSHLLEVMYRWADVYDIAPDAREATQIYGNAIGDARKLAVLEKFMGSSYVGIWCWGELDPNPHGPAAKILLEAFADLMSWVDGQLSLQSHYADLMAGVSLTWSPETGRVDVDVSAVAADLLERYGQSSEQGAILMSRFASTIKQLGELGERIAEYLRAVGDPEGTDAEKALADFGVSDLVGTDQADRLSGEESDDFLPGLGGDDTISGGAGNDTIVGGTGNDALSGNAGADIYRFDSGDGHDTINNYDRDGSLDRLEFGVGVSATQVSVERNHFDLVLRVAQDDSITISSFLDQGGQSPFAINTFRFHDGSEWTIADIFSRLNAPTNGDDYIIGGAASEVYRGLDGVDDIFGNGGNDTLSGDAGNDRVHGNEGDDSVSGGSGNDRLYGGAGDDTLTGGAGDDYLEGGYGSDDYRFEAGFGSDRIYNYASQYYDVADKIDRIVFGAGIAESDVSARRSYNDLYLTVGDGGDQILVQSAFSGVNYAIGAVVFADGTVWDAAEITRQTQIGTAGADLLVGSDIDDTLDGLAGRDTLRGEAGDDALTGGADNDTLEGGAGDDTLTGGAGDDYLEGGYGSDDYRFEAGFGSDRIYNYASQYYDVADKIDRIVFGAGIAESDVSARRSYNDLYLTVGDGGDQILVQSAFSGVNYAIGAVVFADGTVWDAAEITRQTQIGTAGADLLVGSDIDDTLDGLAGRDTLRGEAGDDTLTGGAGDDYLKGGYGSDDYRFEAGFGSDRIYNYASQYYDVADKIDRIVFGAGIAESDVSARRSYNDLYLTVGDGGDQILVQSAFSGVNYAIGAVVFADGTVWDAAEITRQTQIGTAGADLLVGSDIDDTLDGLAGRDTLRGEAGDDALTGGADNDTLEGGAGDDTLTGGAGDDYLKGGYGSDDYRFEAGFGSDRIYNYASQYYDVADKIDRIVFGAGIAESDVSARRSYNDLYLTVGDGGDQILVQSAFSGVNYAIGAVVFADGTVWDAAEITRQTQIGTAGADLLVGSDIDDTLDGLAGRDTLRGEAGDDALTGGADNDTLEGGAGDDTLTGGAGDDYLKGGYGSDDYRFEAGFGSDRIYNYASQYYDVADKIDRIVFGAGIAESDVSARRSYNDLYLTVGDGGDQILVQSAFSGVNYAIGAVVFADGTVWDAAEITRQTQIGTAGADLLVGSDIDDTLDGLAGRDTLRGEAGDDALTGGADNDTLEGGAGDDTLTGGAGDDYLKGGYGSDDYRFEAGFGSDRIYNYASQYYDVADKIDRIVFGAGIAESDVSARRSYNDLYLTVGDGGDQILVQSAFSGVNYAIGAVVFADGTVWDAAEITRQTQIGTAGADLLVGSDIDDTLDGLAGRDTLRGEAGDDALTGGADNDTLEGGAGDDTLTGGAGDDYLKGGYGSDDYRFEAGFGSDRIYNYASQYYDVADKIDRIVFGAGIAESDVSARRSYNDLYLTVGDGGDQILVQSAFSGVNYAIGAVVFADGTVWDAAEITRQTQIGTAGADLLVGSDIDDTLDGLAGRDTLRGEAGDDALTGGADNDTLEGGAGDDTLTGGAGDDYLKGGAGSDHYYVHDAGDRILEYSWESGTDRVSSWVTFDIGGADIELFYLMGADPISGFGTQSEDFLHGNSANNSLYGRAGDDTLNGSAGDDTIDGGTGADLLIGGPGSDRIIVDDAGDRVAESRKWAGHDTVESSVDFRMGRKHIEDLELTGTARLGAGNGLANRITGNDGDNILDGGKNVDTLVGGLGNDRYIIRAPGDNAVEQAGEGNDVVLAYRSYALDAHVEQLFMQTVLTRDGNPTQFNGIGNGLDNTIIGTPFENTIVGREGRDTLKGQRGADTFVFDRAIGPDNVDRIIDFNTNEANEGDILKFKASEFAGMTAGALAADAFVAGTAALDANDRFIFDQASGQLWFDADGSGAGDQVLIATFEQNAMVTAADIEMF